MQGEPGKIDLGSINGIFSPLSSVTHCHQWRLLLSSRRARGRAAGLAAVVQSGGTGRNWDCDPALPKTPTAGSCATVGCKSLGSLSRQGPAAGGIAAGAAAVQSSPVSNL